MEFTFIMTKQITQVRNQRDSVKYILRGSKRRRAKAFDAIRAINSDAGIRANLVAIK